MIYFTLTANSLEEIQQIIKDYYNNYHPAGYGTSISSPKQNPDGSYFASGSRYSSCD